MSAIGDQVNASGSVCPVSVFLTNDNIFGSIKQLTIAISVNNVTYLPFCTDEGRSVIFSQYIGVVCEQFCLAGIHADSNDEFDRIAMGLTGDKSGLSTHRMTNGDNLVRNRKIQPLQKGYCRIGDGVAVCISFCLSRSLKINGKNHIPSSGIFQTEKLLLREILRSAVHSNHYWRGGFCGCIARDIQDGVDGSFGHGIDQLDLLDFYASESCLYQYIRERTYHKQGKCNEQGKFWTGALSCRSFALAVGLCTGYHRF